MHGLIVVFIPIVVITAIGILIWWAIQMEKKRTLALQTLAAEMGMSFSAEQDDSVVQPYQSFDLFDRGRSRKLQNVMYAETDTTAMAIFDYTYTTGHGKNQSKHHQTVVGMQSASMQLPSFLLRPEGIFDRIGSMIGMQDIDFDDHPEFSHAFVLKSEEEEEAVRRFFDQKLMDFFVERKKLHAEAKGHCFIYYQRGRKKPEMFHELMAEAMEIHGALAARFDRN